MVKYTCIIIWYKPSESIIAEWQNEIKNNHDCQFIIVDNTPIAFGDSVHEIKGDNVIYTALNRNMGIAEAQNIGILKALELNVEYIFFFDQDSKIPLNYFKNMMYAYKKIRGRFNKPLILGPKHISINQNIDYKTTCSKRIDNYYITDSVLSSGSLMSIDVIKKIGLMNSKLFIDQVDHEYCYRAAANQIPTVIYENITLPHQIGNNAVRVLGCNFIISAPFRYYYQFRNAIYLLKLDYVDKRIKRRMVIRRCLELVVQPLANFPNSALVLKYIIKGIRDGIKNNL